MMSVNLNLLNEMGASLLSDAIFGCEYKPVAISAVKKGDYFRRKPTAAGEYIRGHYNRKDQFGPANYSCTATEDTNKEICLKPSTVVYVEVV
mgnify:CR=1 FL=1|tara:strand:- start:1992 stop:2267 length:276 start_codon:yes stop_codon:yes gene_type:complete